MTEKEYKNMSIKEFTKAANVYETNKAGIYEICKKDYPAILKEQAQKKNIPNAVFLVGDCENLPFEENSFDVIICSNSFHHYPNPQAFFESVHKVLKPNGRLILRDYTGSAFLLWICNHIEMPLVHLCGHGDVAMRSEKEVREWCQNAGLKVECFERQKGMRMHCVARK